MSEKKKHRTIGKAVFKYALFFITPILIMSILSNTYVLNLLRKNVYTSNKNTIYLYMTQIDSILRDTEASLAEDILDNSYLLSLNDSMSQNELALRSIAIENELSRTLNICDIASGIFAYSSLSDTFIGVSSSNATVKDMVEGQLHSLIDSLPKNDVSNFINWIVIHVNEEHYIVRLFKNGDAYIGAWVDPNDIVGNLATIKIPGLTNIILVGESGQPVSDTTGIDLDDVDLDRSFDDYYLTGPQNQYLVIGQESDMGRFSLVALINDGQIVDDYQLINAVFIVLSIASLGFILLFFNFSNKNIISPIKNLTQAMRQIKRGNFNVELSELQKTDEISFLYSTFNEMTSEIENLKIDIYEEKLLRDKAQLHFYQIQINPHFLINALNTTYGFSLMNDSKMVQEMILCIVSHLRYTLQNSTLVPLAKEIDFLKNYVHMYGLNSPGVTKANVTFNIENNALNVLIPPLSIQSFVENSIKHNRATDSPVSIEISASVTNDSQSSGKLHIIVSDNGKGFDSEAIATLNSGERLPSDDGHKHIGIFNVQQRLMLIYHDDAEIKFSNKEEGGAVVEITISLGGIKFDLI